MTWTERDLKDFRKKNPINSCNINGVNWKYHDVGAKESNFALIFIHGTIGSAEIFWQQMITLHNAYRMISLTIPPIIGLDKICKLKV